MMKKYLFYTTDGFTQDIDGKEIENCQLLGTSCGENITIAYKNFLNENNYIKDYNYNHIMAYEINGEAINV